jgi:ABC-2 type transport system ATP-binding protein
MPIIETHNLSKKFGQRLAVDDLTLEVAEGEVLGFLGPNGAGKTTTIRLLSGIIAPTSGSATVAGLCPDREPEKLHEVIGLLTESAGFYDRLTARRNLEYFAGFYLEIEAKSQVEKYLRLTGLWDRQRDKVGAFSKGMKQRLALARALLHEPEVLFLDEPTAGLDPEAAQEMRQVIRKLSMEGRTVFLSTHNLSEAEYLCHRIAVIRTHLLALDTPANLRQRLFRRRVVVQLETIPESIPEVVRRLSFVEGISQEGEKLLVDLVDPDQNRPELVKCIVDAGGRVLGVSEEQHNLEEVYLSLVREER